MLCELHEHTESFLLTWFLLSIIAVFSLMTFSGILFYISYWKPTYEQWIWKSQPKYPSVHAVQSEIHLMLKGLLAATFCPALSLWMSHRGKSLAYCGLVAPWNQSSPFYSNPLLQGKYYLVLSFFFIWLSVDFFEWGYHRLAHITDIGWKTHKSHHLFTNPSPFAVISDEFVDQFIRALPLVILPAVVPINMDLLFLTFAVFFYGYGVFLHWGYELNYPDAHHPIINSSFQHHLHHRISVKGVDKTFNTGFFFKIWDELAGSVYTGPCFCAKCEQAAGKRTFEQFQTIPKPDYSPLLSLKAWKQFYSK
jgi:lathosterol oxidase